MSLTYEQRYLLEELREYLRRVEKSIARYQVDLDAFAAEFSDTGYSFGDTDKDMQNEKAARRKAIFGESAANADALKKQEYTGIYLRDEE